jgi:hypothetical protein
MLKKMLLAGVAVGVLGGQASAALLYEPFNHQVGQNLPGLSAQTGQTWAALGTTGANGTDNHVITSGSLSVPAGMVPVSGNHATGGGFGQGSRIRISGTSDATADAYQTGSDLYYSYSFRINDIGPLTSGAGGAFLGGFNNLVGTQTGDPSVMAAPLILQRDGTNNAYRVGTRRAGNNVVYHSQTFTTDDTVFLVFRYQIVEGATNDVVQMWVNPTTNLGGPAAPTPSLSSLTNTTLGTGTDLAATGSDTQPTIRSVFFRQVSTASHVIPNAYAVDELRVGTTWAAVTPVPEPGALALLGIGAMGLLARRRRQV